MNNHSNIYIENKPTSKTSREFADEVKEKHKLQKICFCGRLDPMARGKMLFLGNEMCKKMDSYQGFDKVYQFNICVGVKTDTDDPLGLIESYKFDDKTHLINSKIMNFLSKNYNTPRTFSQQFHTYSSIKVNGKPMWLHAMEGNKVTKPVHNVTIKSLKYLETTITKFDHFVNTIINEIENIDDSHKLRQNEIVDMWLNLINRTEVIWNLKYEIEVSSGFYIRQFIRDLSDQINYPLMVYDINRKNIKIV